MTLYEVASTPIRRYIKIMGQTNPYDPAFDRYLGKRLRYRKQRTRNERKWFAEQKATKPTKR